MENTNFNNIEREIKSESFTVLPSGHTIICEFILQNGFSVRGECSVLNPKEFNLDKGKKLSRDRALNSLRMFYGFLEHEREHYYNAKSAK